MDTSAAEVFRKRQAVADLMRMVEASPPATFARIAERDAHVAAQDLLRALTLSGGVLQMPRDEGVLLALLLAAATPDEDFGAFAVATAMLLLDRLQDGGGHDDLYWNWDAFADHYRTAATVERAAIMGGYRALVPARGLFLSNPPTEADCLSRPLHELAGDPLFALDAVSAGAAWAERAGRGTPLSRHERLTWRFLVERDPGIAPPHDAPPVPPPLPR